MAGLRTTQRRFAGTGTRDRAAVAGILREHAPVLAIESLPGVARFL
jgi:hypothetical protein